MAMAMADVMMTVTAANTYQMLAQSPMLAAVHSISPPSQLRENVPLVFISVT